MNLVQLCSSQCNYLSIRLIQLGLSRIYNTSSIPGRRPLCHVNHYTIMSVSDNNCCYYQPCDMQRAINKYATMKQTGTYMHLVQKSKRGEKRRTRVESKKAKKKKFKKNLKQVYDAFLLLMEWWRGVKVLNSTQTGKQGGQGWLSFEKTHTLSQPFSSLSLSLALQPLSWWLHLLSLNFTCCA